MSRTKNSRSSSGRPGAARPACFVLWPASSSRAKARSRSTTRSSTGPARTGAWCSSPTRCFPGSPCRTTWSSGCASRGIPAAQRQDTARRFIAQVGLHGFERLYPKQLSGGMMQRVALARALANDPAILLMDEPFGALDSQTRSLMQELLLDIWQASHKTVLFITHDIDESILLGDRVYVMTARPGRIKEMVEIDPAPPAHRGDADQRRVHHDQTAHHAFHPRGGDAQRRDGAPARQAVALCRRIAIIVWFADFASPRARPRQNPSADRSRFRSPADHAAR